MQSGIIGYRILKTIDTALLDQAVAQPITDAFRQAGFRVLNIAHHLAVYENEFEIACVYLDRENRLWIRALARRWWLLFLVGDRTNRFDAFWRAVDTLEVPLEIIQGTVGENKHAD